MTLYALILFSHVVGAFFRADDLEEPSSGFSFFVTVF